MIEQDLRDALRAQASAYEVGPHAWLEVQRRAGRARRLRWSMLAAVPLAAGAVLAGVPLVILHGGPGTVTGATTAASGEPAPTYKDAYEAGIAANPPIGGTIGVVNPADGRSMRLWFAQVKGKYVDLCSATQLSSGGTVGGCWYDSRNPAHTGENGWYVGGSGGMLPRPDEVISYGAARDAVTKVEAVTRDGSRIPGTIHRPKGAPLAIWTVSYPSRAKVTAFELSGAGEKVLQRVKADTAPPAEPNARPLGPAVELGGGMTARLHEDQTLVWRRDGKVVAFTVVASSPVLKPGETLADTLVGNQTPVMSQFTEGRWFGFARAGTDQVVLTFKGGDSMRALKDGDPVRALRDGGSVRTGTTPAPWNQDAVLFSAPYTHKGDIYAEGYLITGYDRDGREIWREDAKPVPPLWQAAPPSSSPGGPESPGSSSPAGTSGSSGSPGQTAPPR
ncbi:hypothetical protein OG589_05380 [Sphaerisporangium sp. NBC_01403]|uniref:hypothetical protein n=1 Tax=Sphaerisporangium sp. NBC_01403 TaxID=2903599 RepID=UPI0032487C2B